MRALFLTFAAIMALFAQTALVHSEPQVIAWEDLVPKLFAGKRMKIPKKSEVLGQPKPEDFDGDISEKELEAYLGDIEIMKDMQPKGARLNTKLDGITVRIPGYVTPVGFNGEDITEFLLVPFLGACIHVPPPPANQIVYVKNATGLKVEDVWEPVWLTGKLTVNSVTTVLADVGYSLLEGVVEPYDSYKEDVRQVH